RRLPFAQWIRPPRSESFCVARAAWQPPRSPPRRQCHRSAGSSRMTRSLLSSPTFATIGVRPPPQCQRKRSQKSDRNSQIAAIRLRKLCELRRLRAATLGLNLIVQLTKFLQQGFTQLVFNDGSGPSLRARRLGSLPSTVLNASHNGQGCCWYRAVANANKKPPSSSRAHLSR